MIGYAYTPLFGTALTPQGSVEALAFVIDRSSPSFAELSDAEAAAIIATGRGELETNLEYFDNLAAHCGAWNQGSRSKRYDLSYIAPNVP